MAAAFPQLSAFANHNFVLMNGEHWESSENRRYVQAHAWLAEFTRILLEWILQWEPEPYYYCQYNNRDELLTSGGPLEILNYLLDNADVIARNNFSKKKILEDKIRQIARLRNTITHNTVRDSGPLISLLHHMKLVCRYVLL